MSGDLRESGKSHPDSVELGQRQGCPGLGATGGLSARAAARRGHTDGQAARGAPRSGVTRRAARARDGAALWQGRRDRLLSAARSLEAAAKQDPDATAPLKELVRVYSRIGREPDAIRAARRVLEKEPTDADTAHALARL